MSTDENEVRALVAEWHRATQKDDIDTVLKLMTDDALFLIPGRPPMSKAEFAEISAPGAGSDKPTISTNQKIRELCVSGELAYMWSELEVSITPHRSKGSLVRSGTTLTVFRKEQGHWLLARDANLLAPKSEA